VAAENETNANEGSSSGSSETMMDNLSDQEEVTIEDVTNEDDLSEVVDELDTSERAKTEKPKKDKGKGRAKKPSGDGAVSSDFDDEEEYLDGAEGLNDDCLPVKKKQGSKFVLWILLGVILGGVLARIIIGLTVKALMLGGLLGGVSGGIYAKGGGDRQEKEKYKKMSEEQSLHIERMKKAHQKQKKNNCKLTEKIQAQDAQHKLDRRKQENMARQVDTNIKARPSSDKKNKSPKTEKKEDCHIVQIAGHMFSLPKRCCCTIKNTTKLCFKLSVLSSLEKKKALTIAVTKEKSPEIVIQDGALIFPRTLISPAIKQSQQKSTLHNSKSPRSSGAPSSSNCVP
jgi:hypothetical protein